MNEITENEIIKELKLNNRLLALILIIDKESNIERVRLLDRSGFTPSEIADLLNMKINNVTATISNIKKAQQKKPKTKGG